VQTRGSILIGLYNKLRPFTLAPARMVTTAPAQDETQRGCRLINFPDLRESGTAIYLVVSEGAADVYKELIATFIGQAVMEMRLDGVNEPEFPCFVLIDEAYQLNVSEVKRISGIGRGRGVGLGLGYQDLPQMYDQYGREQANAILGTIMTKIFLPGLDDVTAEYASKQLGDTTIFSKTFQDYPGKKQDNTRYAEQKRSLMLPNEIRQTAAHSEVLIISDTAPPIRAAYPPFAVSNEICPASKKGHPKEIHLGDIDAQFLLSGNAGKVKLTDPDRSSLKEIISAGVDKVISHERIAELIGSSHSETDAGYALDLETAEKSDPIANALQCLPEDVRFMTTAAPVSQFSQI